MAVEGSADDSEPGDLGYVSPEGWGTSNRTFQVLDVVSGSSPALLAAGGHCGLWAILHWGVIPSFSSERKMVVSPQSRDSFSPALPSVLESWTWPPGRSSLLCQCSLTQASICGPSSSLVFGPPSSICWGLEPSPILAFFLLKSVASAVGGLTQVK